MAQDPEVVRALEGAVRTDPLNRALRLHLIDLLLAEAQHPAALGHCEVLLQQSPGDADAIHRKEAALAGFAAASPRAASLSPTQPDRERVSHEPLTDVPVSDLFDIVRPAVTLADVAGMTDVKQRLRLSFLEPMRNDELRRAFGHSLRSSLLLWGPPGCGKTFLAKALAGELGLYFIHVGIADILEMWLGNSERNVERVFDEARRMRPTLMFIDELDALGHKRSQTSGAVRNVVNQLLLELDGATSDNEGLLVLGATNQVWDVDPALLRPGRFDRKVVVLPPDLPARAAILAHHLRKSPTEDLDLDSVARNTEGYSGADLARICSAAAEFALHDSVRAGSTRPVNQRHLEAARRDTPPSTRPWFNLAENYIAFSDDRDEYADLARYLTESRARWRRR
ncbi:ATP-dependent zinc metalloprotease FtsH [Mycobacterium sp. THAF192]|nr:ATP-dependent zinc metalloprotease FtsH [Mycobacterium sp. THAF192]